MRYMGCNGIGHDSVVVRPRDVPDPWRSSRGRSRQEDEQMLYSSTVILVCGETMGAFNEAGMNFLCDLGRRITKHTQMITARAPSFSNAFLL